jgi:hypothetical protein
LIIFKIWNLSKVILALGRLSLTPLIKAGDISQLDQTSLERYFAMEVK